MISSVINIGLSEVLGLSEKVMSKLRPKGQQGVKGIKFYGKNISNRGSSGGGKALEKRKMARV